MAGRPRPQPFRFWMPFWSNPASIPSRPPLSARQQPLPRTPTADLPPLPRRPTRSSALSALPALSSYSPQEENAGQNLSPSASSSPSPTQSLPQSQPFNGKSESQPLSSTMVQATLPTTTQASRQLEQDETITSPSPESASLPESPRTTSRPSAVIVVPPLLKSREAEDSQAQLDSNPAKEEENPKTNQDSETDGNHSQLLEIQEKPDQVNEDLKMNENVKQELNPVETMDSEIMHEESDKEEVIENEESQIPKIQTDAISESMERSERKPSGSAADIKISSKASKVNLDLGISKPANGEKIDNSNRGRPMRDNGLNIKGTKLAILDIPRGSLLDGHRAKYQKEIEDGFSKLTRNQVHGVAERPRYGSAPVNMITLAGENTGASMVIGYEIIEREAFVHTHGRHKLEKDSSKTSTNNDARNKEMLNSRSSRSQGMAASVNSNVQSINNSTLQDSSCSANNPGVHMEITSKQVEPVVQISRMEPCKEKMEPLKDKVRGPISYSDKKLPHEPRVRRRCLRALFMESESDPENPQKPRRHGCRFSCVGETGSMTLRYSSRIYSHPSPPCSSHHLK